MAGSWPILATTAEILRERVPIQPKPGGQPGDDGDKRRAVRLARGRELERHGSNPTAPRITSRGAGRPVHSSNEAATLRDEHLDAGDDAGAPPRAATAVAVAVSG